MPARRRGAPRNPVPPVDLTNLPHQISEPLTFVFDYLMYRSKYKGYPKERHMSFLVGSTGLSCDDIKEWFQMRREEEKTHPSGPLQLPRMEYTCSNGFCFTIVNSVLNGQPAMSAAAEQVLKRKFARMKYMYLKKDALKKLSRRTGLSETAIKKWFTNERMKMNARGVPQAPAVPVPQVPAPPVPVPPVLAPQNDVNDLTYRIGNIVYEVLSDVRRS